MSDGPHYVVRLTCGCGVRCEMTVPAAVPLDVLVPEMERAHGRYRAEQATGKCSTDPSKRLYTIRPYRQ